MCPIVDHNGYMRYFEAMVEKSDDLTVYLLESDGNRRLIRPLIEGFFRPQYQAGVVNLFEGLERLVELSIEWEIPILPPPLVGFEGEVVRQLSDVVDYLYDELDEEELPPGEGTKDNNPFVAKKLPLSDYTLAALVCNTKIDPQIRFLFDQIRVLYLGYAWGSTDPVLSKNDTALELRKIAINNEYSLARREYLHQASFPVEAPNVANLVSVLSKLPEPDEVAPDEVAPEGAAPDYLWDLYDELSRLTTFWIERVSESSGQSKPSNQGIVSVGQRPRPKFPPIPSTGSGRIPGSNGALKRSPFVDAKPKSIPVQIGRPVTGEPPDQLQALELDLEDFPEALTIVLGTSRYWLQDIYSLTSVSRGVLDEEERAVLTGLFDAPDPEESVADSEARLLIELSYVTGLPMDLLLKLTLGPSANIDCEGRFTRKIHKPVQSFVPCKTKMHNFRTLLTQFTLQLPAKLTKKIEQIAPPDLKSSLEECLKTPAEVLLKRVEARICEINTENELEIGLDDISLSLRNAVYLVTQNPGLTLHIAGLDGYAPPSMAWYQGVDQEQLQSSYDLAISGLDYHV